MRHAARVDANQKDIVDALRACGCSVYVIGRPVDLLVGIMGQNYLLEIKSGRKARYTRAQMDFRATWRGRWCRVETVDEALLAVGVASPIWPVSMVSTTGE